MYETLEAYQSGSLSFLWARELNALRDAHPKYSPYRAGEIAAAKIAAQASHEYGQLEAVLRENADEGTQEARLYDWLSDHDDIKSVLVEMSGTRTILADMEAFLDIPQIEALKAFHTEWRFYG